MRSATSTGLFAEGELDQSSEFISVGYGGTEFTNAPGGPTAQYLDTRMYDTGTFSALGPVSRSSTSLA